MPRIRSAPLSEHRRGTLRFVIQKARGGVDIVAETSTSVATGRTMDEIATGKKTANEAQEDRAGDAEREFVLDREIVAVVDGEVARFQALEDRMHVTDADSSVSAMTNPPEMSGASPRAYSPGKR